MSEIKLYQPSNGSEGCSFIAAFCDQCIKEPISEESDNKCLILTNSMAYDIDEPEYPKQWRYVDGEPTCTAFVSREEHNKKRRENRKDNIIARDTQTVDMFGNT